MGRRRPVGLDLTSPVRMSIGTSVPEWFLLGVRVADAGSASSARKLLPSSI